MSQTPKTTVIFDWHGTLAHFEGAQSNYQLVFHQYGWAVDASVIDGYHASFDGVDHQEHSLSKSHYEAWTRHRLDGLASSCGVAEETRAELVEALLESDQAVSMVCFPEVPAVLAVLRAAGYRIAVCSNWGWDLEPHLESTGVSSFLDVALSSARVGCRKPNPRIYAAALQALGVDASSAIFVGDSWFPDVLGPLQAGITAVHIARGATRSDLPELPDGAHRVGNLRELFELGLLEPSLKAPERSA